MDFVDRDALEACIQEVTDGVHAEGRRIAEAKGRTYLPEANGLRVRKALEDAGLLALRTALLDAAAAVINVDDDDTQQDGDDAEPLADGRAPDAAGGPETPPRAEGRRATPPRGSRSRSRSPHVQRPADTALMCSPTHLVRGPHRLTCERCGDRVPAMWMKLSAGPAFAAEGSEGFAAERVVSAGMELCYRCTASFMLDIPERFETTGKLEDTVLLCQDTPAGFVAVDFTAGSPESARPLPTRSRSWMQDEHLCCECKAELICWSCINAEDMSLELCSKCFARQLLAHHQKNQVLKKFVEVTHRH